DWSRDGRYLVFTADLGGVPNAYAYDVDRDRILKLTNVPFGALEPALSPDGRTLAFIDYHRERYDLATIAFRPDLAESVPRTLASAGRDLNWTALLNRSLPPDTLASAARPYNPLRHLAPRALYPFVQLDDTPSSDTDIGTGIGLDLQGADPLQSWAYELRGYYQEHRLWGAASLETGSVFGRPRLTAYAKPLSVALSLGDGPRRIYEERGLSLDVNTPVVFSSDVSSTYASLALQGRLREVRLLDVPGSTDVSGTRFTLKPSVRLVSGLRRNARDLVPNAGIVVTASADADLWSDGPRKSATTTTRVFAYLPLLRSINHSIRLGAGVLTRNEKALVDVSSFFPRGYEGKAIGSGRFFRYGVEYVAPLWYPDNGFVLLPVYVGAVYAYSFAEHLRAYGVDEGFRNATSLGVGLGLRVRLFFNAEADLRIGAAYRVQDRDWVVTGR
ncbi:MAG TPA: hypothetical protein VFG50_12610, partial [Rhodothermales bacterium]|nr:hypothetical protein [Rhodothermales bacterium]